MNYSIADLRPSRLKTYYKYDDRVNLWTTRELIWTCQMPPFNINSKSKGEVSSQPQTQRNWIHLNKTHQTAKRINITSVQPGKRPRLRWSTQSGLSVTKGCTVQPFDGSFRTSEKKAIAPQTPNTLSSSLLKLLRQTKTLTPGLLLMSSPCDMKVFYVEECLRNWLRHGKFKLGGDDLFANWK